MYTLWIHIYMYVYMIESYTCHLGTPAPSKYMYLRTCVYIDIYIYEYIFLWNCWVFSWLPCMNLIELKRLTSESLNSSIEAFGECPKCECHFPFTYVIDR